MAAAAEVAAVQAEIEEFESLIPIPIPNKIHIFFGSSVSC
jgi:hypothetical protein